MAETEHKRETTPEDDEVLDLRPLNFDEVLRGVLATDPEQMPDAEEPDQAATQRTDRASA